MIEPDDAMKLVVITYGTEGDTRPLVALCRALMDAGHRVQLLADRNTLSTAHALGVPATALAGDIRGTLDADNAIGKVVADGHSPGRAARALAGIANAHAQAWLKALVEAGQGCDGIVISGLAGFVGLSAAEALRVPAIGTGMIPLTATAEFAHPFLPPRLVPRWLRRASHEFVNGMLWRAFRAATNCARASVCGLPPQRTLWKGHPMLYGVSPTLMPQPADWPGYAMVCGQWVHETQDVTPPAGLADFLAQGEAPVYVGFGSMMGFNPTQAREAIVGALAGRRAVFQPGWSGIETSGLPDHIFVVGETPHQWLFPKMSAVVHHGGSGTSHSAARAGVPAVVVPFAGDQPFWADRLWRLGVAPEPVPARQLNVQRLRRAIDAAQDARMRAKAREVGERMRAERGLAVAVNKIERLLSRT
ncbi:glycosyltransferase [Azospirillum sp. CT11-132]|uniref:glycosyltransferase n=1 Tax=Azospirillum sp. CT11-132 TaxID=3396317 RepID=UPI0039A5391A